MHEFHRGGTPNVFSGEGAPHGLVYAHYASPHGENPQSGEFDFESDHPLNSKANLQDARFRMLDAFGKEAVSWQIVKVERAKADTPRQLPATDA